MIQPAKIADILGGERILHRPIHSIFELERAVEEGPPKGALKNVAGFVSSSRDRFKFIYRVVPQGTYK